jgi:AcrR family transcriptional regulator
MFSRHGVRRASMALIAREAGVAKPTLYAYFRDKDALYAGVCTLVGEQILAAARDAAASPAPIPRRVTGVLAAKFGAVFELVQTSPYSQELLNPPSAAARAAIEAADAAFRREVGALIASAVRSGELDLGALHVPETGLVSLLMQTGYGAGYGAESVAEHRRNLEALVASLLRAGLPGDGEAKPSGARGHKPSTARVRRTARKPSKRLRGE